MKSLGKTGAGVNVLTAARERFATLYDRFDHVSVSFSGGKDSTVCLNLAIEAAQERGRLPVHALFFDEEAMHDETIEYVDRVRQDPRVHLRWLCLPVRHRNACSRREPYWYPWEPEARERWCRPLPECAETSMPGFVKGMPMKDAVQVANPTSIGLWVDVRGIRADESLRRYASVTRRMKDNWITFGNRNFHAASPIYDWTSIDVWTAPRLMGWDYNRAYDVMNMMGIPPSLQRVCPPFGEEPLANLPRYAAAWPDLWAKMCNRVHGAATAGRYARSELYGYGGMVKPKELTWREWTFRLLDLYPEALRVLVADKVEDLMRLHSARTSASIPEDSPDPATGLSWKFLAMIANRADLKGRKRQSLKVADTVLEPDDGDTRY